MNRIEIDLNAAPLNEQLPEDVAIGFTAFGFAITNPWLTEDARDPVTPRYYGFRGVNTGGDCTAWQRIDVEDDEEWTYLITDLHDGMAPTRPYAMEHGWQLGAYVDGDQRWSLYVRPDGTGWVDYADEEEGEEPRFRYDAKDHQHDDDFDIAIVETATDHVWAMTNTEEKAARIVEGLNKLLTDDEKHALRYVWGGMGDGYASDILQRLWE